MRCTHSVPAATLKSQVSFWPFWLPSAAQRESGVEEEEEVASSLFGGVLFLRLPPAARAPKIKPRLRPSLCILDGRRRLVLFLSDSGKKNSEHQPDFLFFRGSFYFPLTPPVFPFLFWTKFLAIFIFLGLFFSRLDDAILSGGTVFHPVGPPSFSLSISSSSIRVFRR